MARRRRGARLPGLGLGVALCAAAPSLAQTRPEAEAKAPKPAVASPAARLTGKSQYSQGNEELIIRDFFQGRRGGRFLDVGCASPVANSNTYYLERHLGWSGIAVDALPEYAQAWKRKRPRSQFFNYLVSDHSETVEPFYRSELRGTSSARKEGMKGPAGKPVRFDEIQVPTITLTELLERNGVSRIDFLSMDIEGAEPLALMGFDLGRFGPELACIEAKPANRATLMEYFTSRGYRRLDRYLDYDKTNYYFAPEPDGSNPRP